ncbi:MAG: hypothetical protein ACRD2S_02285, partial [Terriglobales bacterium]
MICRRLTRCLGSQLHVGIVLLLILFLPSFAAGQARPEDGGHEIELWTGGGHSVPGGISNVNAWNIGARYG